MKFWTKNIITTTLVLVGLVFGYSAYGIYSADKLGKASFEQLRLVWPGLLGIDESNRRFLAKLSLECDVVSEPANTVAVLQCLSRAVDVRDKKSGTSEAHERFKKLLRDFPVTAP